MAAKVKKDTPGYISVPQALWGMTDASGKGLNASEVSMLAWIYTFKDANGMTLKDKSIAFMWKKSYAQIKKLL